VSGAPADASPPPRPAATAVPVALADLERGARARIVSVAGAPGTSQRLLEMGLTAGTAIEVVRFAPLGDPIEVKVRGYRLSLRAAEARGVLVERVS
jgi:ferrous iron transport protein A